MGISCEKAGWLRRLLGFCEQEEPKGKSYSGALASQNEVMNLDNPDAPDPQEAKQGLKKINAGKQ